MKKYWNSFKTRVADPSKKSTRNKILSTASIGLVASYLYFTSESPGAQIRKMVDIFEKGKIDREADAPIPGTLIKREDLEKSLIETLRPFSGTGNYFLIVGEYGTGKSTLVRNIILKLEKPKGVVHFTCPSESKDFAKNLANHLGCELYPFKLRDVIVKEQKDNSEYPNWSLLKMRLSDAANYYMRKHNRPIVLVLDQVDRVAKQDLNFFSILQDFAKDHADGGTIIIIFIASEARSAWSRGLIPFEVGDIPDEQAVKFLLDFNIDPKIAEHVVKYLTGGRFSLLKKFQSQYRVDHGENTFEEFKEKLFAQTDIELIRMKLPENHEFFKQLNKVHRIKIKDAVSYIPLDMIHKLVSVSILKEHPNSDVSFHSRYVETYFKEAFQATTSSGKTTL